MNGGGWVNNVLICLQEFCVWMHGYNVSFRWVLE